MRRHSVGIAALLLGSLVALPGFADAREHDTRTKASRLGGNPSLAKVSSQLLNARRLASEGASVSHIRAVNPILRFRDDRPEVEIRLRTLTPAIVARIKELGMHVSGVHYDYARIVGECDLAKLDEIAAIPEVAVIHPNYGTWASAGAVTSQGDVSLRANEARSAFGVDGTGVQVGILADSFHGHGVGGGTVTGTGCSRTLTGSSPQLSGDLPAAVTVLDNCSSGGSGCSFVVDEGAALAETVHDVAPGAAILFHSAFNSEADFAQGISELRACGADVLIDDALFLAEPMFQDGIVAQAVQSAVNAGASYFSAAGNQAAFGIDEVYVDAVPATDDTTLPPSGRDLHDFGSNNRFGKIVIPDGCGVLLVLQWNQPYSGTLGPGASNDLDLYLCSSDSLALDPGGSLFACNGNGALEVGDDSQSCGGAEPPSGNPFEILLYVNTSGSSVDGYVAVEHYCGTQSGVRFRVATFGINCDLTEPGYSFEAGILDQSSMYGHPTAAGANAVGSVFYGEVDSRGTVVAPTSAVNVNPSSSRGGNIPFYFSGSGSPLPGAPVTRFKPQFVAPDGTNTTFFGLDIPDDADTHPNFFGTSAAAAHAAAVAALLLDGEPTLTPQQVENRLSATAVDLEAPGVDATAGAGLIQAYFAVGNIACNQLSPAEVLSLALARTTPGGSTVRLSWSPTPSAISYRVYRGMQKNLSDLSCFLQGVGTNEAIDDGAVPGASQVLYYLVTARNCAGESTLGTMKPAAPRPTPPACP